jgi:hypothetical protein
MSHARAAALAEELTGASFSASAWGKAEKGLFSPPPDRIAIMAMVVGLSAGEVEQAGRPDVAALMREDVRRRASDEPAMASVDVASVPEELLQVIVESLGEIRRAEGLSVEQREVIEAAFIRTATRNLSGQIDQLRTALEITGH